MVFHKLKIFTTLEIFRLLDLGCPGTERRLTGTLHSHMSEGFLPTKKRHFISTKIELQYQYMTYNALNVIPPL